MINEATQQRILSYLSTFLDNFGDSFVDRFRKAQGEFERLKQRIKKGEFKPFHEAILSEAILPILAFERAFSTPLGTTFEECARMIASDRYKHAERGFNLSGAVSAAATSTIDSIESTIETQGMRSRYLEFARSVALAYEADPRQRRVKIDLYIIDHGDNEIFFELKTPKPNAPQSIRAVKKMLQIHAIRRETSPKVQSYYAMAFNPYGQNRTDYNHGPALRYLDFQNQGLIAEEFWDFIGGPGTYAEVLALYQSIGQQKGEEVVRKIALT